MNTCVTCGMLFEGDHANDLGMHTEYGPVCKFDSEQGVLKSPEAIYAGGVQFFSQYTDGDQTLAERMTRSNMKSLPYWRAHPFELLNGPEASPEEFQTVMARI